MNTPRGAGHGLEESFQLHGSCNLGGSVKRVSAGCVNRESTDVPQSVVAALSQLHRVQRASEALYMCACVLNKRWFQ